MMSGPEERLVAWLRRRLGDAADAPGDDAAILPAAGSRAVSVDQQVEGVHFVADLEPRLVGRRLVGVCLSDLAAAGAEPAYGFLTVAAPAAYPLRRLLRAVIDAAQGYGIELAGGDVARAPRLALTLTVLGRHEGRGHWLRRSTARPGDSLWLGGPVGESALGRILVAEGAAMVGRGVRLPMGLELPGALQRAARRAVRRHLTPRPQLELGLRLARRRRVAAIDISDGLAIDLHRLCRESGVGARIAAEALPIPVAVERCASRLGESALDLALTGGEDYVLLFTLPARASKPPPSCHRIGSITANELVHLERGGRLELLPPAGWDHLRPGRPGPPTSA